MKTRDGIPWPATLRILVMIGVAAWLATMASLDPGAFPWAVPLLVYLGLRVSADLASALPSENPNAAAVTAALSALSWSYIPLGLHWFARAGPRPDAPVWLIGLMLLIGGLALAAHHEPIRHRHPRTARLLGLLGLLVAAPGLAMATTVLPLASPWDRVLPVSIGIAALVLGVLMRPRATPEDDPAQTDWRSWLRQHRFRFTLIGLLVIAYLLVRTSLVGTVFFLPLWEFAAAIALTGFLLWSLRSHLRPRLLEDPITSPYERHTTSVQRQSEDELDDWEEAFGDFLDHGDHNRLNQLVVRLEREDHVPARRAFLSILTHRTPHGMLLVHPVWPYLAQILTLLLLAYGLLHYGGLLEEVIPGASTVLPLTALAVGLWAMQFNRHGGPWWVKTLIAYASLAFLPLIEVQMAHSTIPGPLTLLATPLGLLVALGLLGLPLVHAWLARRPQSPRFAYRGNDPRAATKELTRTTERALLVRTAGAAAGGILVFLVIAELARHVPHLAVLFPVYLLTALLILIHPLVIAVGLRFGARRVTRLNDRETALRRHHVEGALKKLKSGYQGTPMPK